PAKQGNERREPDENRQPISDGNTAKQRTGAQDRPDRRRVRPFHEALHVTVRPVTGEDWSRDQNKNERRKKNPDRRHKRAPEACDQVANERGRDHHRTGADHPDGDSNQEVALVQPPVLLHDALLQKGNDYETASEGEGTRLEKEQEQFREGGGTRDLRHWRERRERRRNHERRRRRAALPESAVVEDSHDTRT